MDSLNTKQQQAVEAVLNGKNIFLTGPGGTGKSFTIKYIIELLKDKNYGLTATTGTSALPNSCSTQGFFAVFEGCKRFQRSQAKPSRRSSP